MEELTQNLEALLSDKNKQDWIEVRIVKRLHQHDPNGSMTKIFYDALTRLQNLRTPRINIYGKLTYWTVGSRDGIPLDEFTDSLICVQTEMGFFLGPPISISILYYLYDLNNQASSLKMIQELIVMSKEEEYQKYARLFEFIIKFFYLSRRLLTVTLAPQIIDQYVSKYIGSTNRPVIESYESKGIKRDKKEICKFRIDGEPYICEFSKKLEGKFFGSVVQIRPLKSNKTKKSSKSSKSSLTNKNKSKTYYVKAHYGYPVYNRYANQEDTYDLDLIKYAPSTKFWNKYLPIYKLRPIDLREPFMYKLFDELGYGPKTYIMINPYLPSGLFIVTEDLILNNSMKKNNIFLNVEEIETKIQTDRFNSWFRSSAKEFLTIKATELSLLSIIFNICDLHWKNWGFIASIGACQRLLKLKKPLTSVEIFIIDFLIADDKEESLKDIFLNGKNLGKETYNNYRFLGLLQTFALARRVLFFPNIDKKREADFIDSYKTKIKQGQKALNYLNEHLNGKTISEIIKTTKSILIEQLRQYSRIWETKEDETKEDKTKEDEIKEDETKEDEIKEDKTKEDETKEDETKEDKIKEDETKEDKIKEDETKEDKIKEDETKEDKIKEDETKEDKIKEDKIQEEKIKEDIKPEASLELEEASEIPKNVEEQLNNYCKSIINNFNNLTSFLKEDYKKHLKDMLKEIHHKRKEKQDKQKEEDEEEIEEEKDFEIEEEKEEEYEYEYVYEEEEFEEEEFEEEEFGEEENENSY